MLVRDIDVHLKLVPKPHQQEALQQVLTTLKSQDRCTVAMACGTGKTLLGLWIAESLNARSIIIFVPSLSLLQQTFQAWLANTILENPYCLAVCCDKSVTEADDIQDIDIPVTTSTETIKLFLKKKPIDRVSIVFATYQSAPMISAAMSKRDYFDYGIYDEAHKTAGEEGKLFAHSLFDNNLKINKRLFLTATPRIIIPGKNIEEDEYISMDNRSVYGDVVYQLSFKSAIKQDLVTDYRVLVPVITDTQVQEMIEKHRLKIGNKQIDAKHLAQMIAIDKVAVEFGIKKILTFHTTVNDAEKFGETIAEHHFGSLDKFNSFHVNGSQTASIRQKTLKAFENSAKAVVTNARCLTEGVDVPNIDTVAFMAAKNSAIDVVQAIGRLSRKFPSKKMGYVLLPLYFSGNDATKLDTHSEYKNIVRILRNLQEYDENLKDDMSLYHQYGIQRDSHSITQKLYFFNTDIQYENIAQKIHLKMLNNVADSWHKKFEELKKFYKIHGHCNINKEENVNLYQFSSYQRVLYKRKQLTAERIKKLEELDFIWDHVEYAWERNFIELKVYKNKHGHIDVLNDPDAPRILKSFIIRSRHLFSKKRLSKERIDKLNSIGFIWNASSFLRKKQDEKWDIFFNKLKKYYDKYEDISERELIIRKIDNNLFRWMIEQRTRCNNRQIKADRLEKLNSISFVLNVSERVFKQNLTKLADYKKLYGNCMIAQSHDKKLYVWTGNLRTLRKTGRLTNEQINLLNEIGFDWSPRVSRRRDIDKVWKINYEKLKSWKIKNKIEYITAQPGMERALRKWLTTQRTLYQNKSLPKEKVKLLEDIGVVFSDIVEFMWHEQCEKLIKFKEKYNHFHIYKVYCDTQDLCYRKLYAWATRQLRSFQQGVLEPQRIKKLKDIGFL